MKTSTEATASEKETVECCTLSHLAIIMDGNGRWAKERGLPRTAGHRAGTETAKLIVQECLTLGIKHLTLYTFSKENWKRPKDEIVFLFELLAEFLRSETKNLIQQGVSLRILGDIADLPFPTRKALEYAIDTTKNGEKLLLNLALNYSGRDEIVFACKQYVAQGNSVESLTPELLAEHLYTKGQPDPDLVIRTSGEQRTSNFLLYQTAYSEFYFTETYWPDFTAECLQEALSAFYSRNRRFGAI